MSQRRMRRHPDSPGSRCCETLRASPVTVTLKSGGKFRKPSCSAGSQPCTSARRHMMRFRLTFWTLLFVMVFAELTQAQSGPCTQSTIGHSRVPVADDAFSFMPPYGKPVIGKAAIGETDTKAFSDRT